MRFAERSAEHREVLAEHKDQPPVHRTIAGNDAIAGDLVLVDAEIAAAVLDEHVPFLEGTGVEQQLEPLACGQLAAAMLRLDAASTPAGPGRFPLSFQAVENFLHVASQPTYEADSIDDTARPEPLVGALPRSASCGNEDGGMAQSDLYEKGAAMRRQLMGDAAVERSARDIYSDPVMKKFIDMATERGFGALWTRPGLDLKTRALICVVSDAATGREPELGLHLRMALRQG